MTSLKRSLLASLLMIPAFANAPSLDAEANVPLEDEQVVDINDPLEPFNRVIYAVNGVIDGLVVKPLAITWRLVLPQPARDSAENVLKNLKSPVTFANHLLQGEPARAATAVGRFIVNTTVGILGIFDAASDLGMPGEETSFNETLGVWGVNTGPYLIIPVLGPCSFRHAVGIGGDYFMQPYNYYFKRDSHKDERWVPTAITAVDAVHQRNKVLEKVDEVVANSADPYATFRSAYFQSQAYRIKFLKEKR